MSEPVYLQQRRGVLANRTGDTTVLLDLDSGEYYTLDEVGGRIWDLCDGTRSAEEVIEHLCAEYDAPEPEIRDDIEQFLEELVQEKLLVEGD